VFLFELLVVGHSGTGKGIPIMVRSQSVVTKWEIDSHVRARARTRTRTSNTDSVECSETHSIFVLCNYWKEDIIGVMLEAILLHAGESNWGN